MNAVRVYKEKCSVWEPASGTLLSASPSRSADPETGRDALEFDFDDGSEVYVWKGGSRALGQKCGPLISTRRRPGTARGKRPVRPGSGDASELAVAHVDDVGVRRVSQEARLAGPPALIGR